MYGKAVACVEMMRERYMMIRVETMGFAKT
jgi:hypothetical protein